MSGKDSRGIRDFKHFLEFAERGPSALGEAAAPLGRGTDSPFEDAVLAALEADGWTVHPQVGVSAFRIDLGIVHPDAPGRYLAGIECDGATYHGSATARDRDRLRESVLVGLGWRIRRVWSTDWWMDAETACSRLVEQLRRDLAEDCAQVAMVAQNTIGPPADGQPQDEDACEGSGSLLLAPEPERPRAFEDPGTEFASASQPRSAPEPAVVYARQTMPTPAVPKRARGALYAHADLTDAKFSFDPERFYDPDYAERLRAMVAHVIAVEGPVFDDVLVTRLARAHGFARSGGRIREAVLVAVHPDCARTTEAGRTIFWPMGSIDTENSTFRSSLDGGRDHVDVPLVELVDLARRFQGDEITVVRTMADVLGVKNIREQARARLLLAVRGAHS